MSKKSKVNRLKSLLIYILTSIILAVFAAVPMLIVGYVWVLYAVKTVALWEAIVPTVTLAIAEGLILVMMIGSGE